MQKIVEELNSVIAEYLPKVRAIPHAAFYSKSLPSKWSKIEILGHLIDSAQNNIRRFICVQYELSTPQITYNQDRWVALNHYQSSKLEDVIQLWWLINERISAVLAMMDEAHYTKIVDTGTDSIHNHSVLFLAEDYVRHMRHHLNQIV